MTQRMTAAALLVAALITLPAGADTDELARCSQISNPLDRLACYDALAAAARGNVAATVTPAPAPASLAPAATPTPAPIATPRESAPPADSAASFGFEKQRFKEGDTEMVARYVGEFSGWSGGTLFKLDNGQVWKQAQSGRVFHRRSNPVITIRRGALGSFRLSVEGTKRSVRVKRVK